MCKRASGAKSVRNYQADHGIQRNQIIEETESPSTKDPRGTRSFRKRSEALSGITKSSKNVQDIEKISDTL